MLSVAGTGTGESVAKLFVSGGGSINLNTTKAVNTKANNTGFNISEPG